MPAAAAATEPWRATWWLLALVATPASLPLMTAAEGGPPPPLELLLLLDVNSDNTAGMMEDSVGSTVTGGC